MVRNAGRNLLNGVATMDKRTKTDEVELLRKISFLQDKLSSVVQVIEAVAAIRFGSIDKTQPQQYWNGSAMVDIPTAAPEESEELRCLRYLRDLCNENMD